MRMSQQPDDAVKTALGLAVSLLIAAAIYLLTDQLFFGLVVLGAAIMTAAAKILIQRNRRSALAGKETSVSPIKRGLLHDRLVVRFAALYGATAVLFVSAWLVSYYLLPEAALSAPRVENNLLESAPSLARELAYILAWNLTLPLIITAGANFLLRINGFPLGYLMPLLWGTWYGLLIGSNSFTVPMLERMVPSLAVLQRAGPYEFAGYCLIAVATYRLSQFEIKHFLEGKIERVSPPVPLSITYQDWIGVGLGVLLLILAGWREAAMIVIP